MCRETVRLALAQSLSEPMPYKSLLTEGCLASGRDFNDRGVTYDYHESMPMGIPNVADSLAAIDRLVFTAHKLTLSELVEQMRLDYPHEAIRQALAEEIPKYESNMDAVVDAIKAVHQAEVEANAALLE